jgi:hypothetical protein
MPVHVSASAGANECGMMISGGGTVFKFDILAPIARVTINKKEIAQQKKTPQKVAISFAFSFFFIMFTMLI